MVSPDGGVDIEEVAEKTPERILKMPIDIHTGRSNLELLYTEIFCLRTTLNSFASATDH